ncbi:unnamed protein product [Heterosigma akashiwo]
MAESHYFHFSRALIVLAVLILPNVSICFGFTLGTPCSRSVGAAPAKSSTRKEFIEFGLSLGFVGAAVSPSAALAFENRIAERKNPATPGPQPKDLGLRSDGSLKGCPASPNCFSSSVDPDDDEFYGTNHLAGPWRYPAALGPAQALTELQEVVASYPPGQAGIDGGGFKVQKATGDYLYVQFESLRRGFVDDVEFLVAPGPERRVLVRSTSVWDSWTSSQRPPAELARPGTAKTGLGCT